MAEVTGYTAPRMKAIEDASIVNGVIDENRHLILTRFDGTPVDAGVVFPPEPEQSSMFAIGEVTLGADALTIDFVTIPQTFKVLKLFATVRSSIAGSAFANLHLSVNNDTSDASYYNQLMQGQGAVVSASEKLAVASSRSIATIPAANASAGSMCQVEVTIVNYANATKLKPINAHAAASWGGASGNLLIRDTTLLRASTQAINRLTLQANAGNLIAGSSASLYGLKSAFG